MQQCSSQKNQLGTHTPHTTHSIIQLALRLQPTHLSCCCRKVDCSFAKDHKSSQLKRGSRHNCRIDETIQLEVTGDKESGETLTIVIHCSVSCVFGIMQVFCWQSSFCSASHHMSHALSLAPCGPCL